MASGRSGSPGVCFVIILLLGILAVALSLSLGWTDRERERKFCMAFGLMAGMGQMDRLSVTKSKQTEKALFGPVSWNGNAKGGRGQRHLFV